LSDIREYQARPANNGEFTSVIDARLATMQTFEFLIPERPVSLQTKSRRKLQAWKAFVRGEGEKIWPTAAKPVALLAVRITIVYLCDRDPADSQVSDVDSHRRFLTDTVDLTALPPLIQQGALVGKECVYVRICAAQDLRSYL
jgi:hypothetical protein